jgi:hypothetical protein
MTSAVRLVSESLVARAGVDRCDACLAMDTRLAVAEVTEQATHLARTPLYLRDEWQCADCGAHGIVTRALEHRA